jgi:hypothetical protein
MQARYMKALLSLAAAAALAVPAVAQASHGSDDPANHVRREHHRAAHHIVRVNDDRGVHHSGSDDHGIHHSGSDDGPNHS